MSRRVLSHQCKNNFSFITLNEDGYAHVLIEHMYLNIEVYIV